MKVTTGGRSVAVVAAFMIVLGGVAASAPPAAAESGAMIEPVDGLVTSNFGRCGSGSSHRGIDIAGNAGKPIGAAYPGAVAVVAFNNDRGNWVKVVHDGGYATIYQHMASRAVVAVGDHVDAGQTLGYVGRTGSVQGATGYHLHFEVLRGDVPQNLNAAYACGSTKSKGNPILWSFPGLAVHQPGPQDPGETPPQSASRPWLYDQSTDFDHDGGADVFWANPAAWQVSVQGLGVWAQRGHALEAPANELRLVDFDGDGDADVFWVNPNRWKVSIDGTGPWMELASEVSASPDQLRVVDFDGDGSSDDVVWLNPSKWKVSINGTSPWSELAGEVSASADQLRVVDYDGDGRTNDVFWVNPSKWKVSINGTSPWRDLASEVSALVGDLRVA